jgi:hypothetical protein
MQQDIIKNFFASCEGGYHRVTHVRVDWLWTSDVSGAIYKEGRPGRLHTSQIAELCTEDPELHPQFAEEPVQLFAELYLLGRCQLAVLVLSSLASMQSTRSRLESLDV